MGLRGPRPKPTALKKAQGTFQKCRAAKNELVPAPGIPIAPAWLDKTAKAEWARVIPELAEKGVLSVIDGAALEGYVSNYSLAVRYQRLADKAPTIKSRFGSQEPNPAAGAARKHWALARQFAAEFGLTPSARTRISMPTKPKEHDAVEEFLFGPLKRGTTPEDEKRAAAQREVIERLKREAAADDADEPGGDDSPPDGHGSVN